MDGTEFKEGDIIKIKTEEHTYVGIFVGFDITEFFHKKRIILDITDDTNADVGRMYIKFATILRITRYAEVKNDKRGPNTRP
jgi:hypothetical protein